jgi:ketosteroid isomerase-like protein
VKTTRKKRTAKAVAAQILLAAMTISTVCLTACQKQAATSDAESVAQIRAVLDRQVEAWNRRDLEGFMDGYWNSPDLTFYSGTTPVSGWETTIGRYRQRYQSDGAEMGNLEFSDLIIEPLGPNAAFVRGRWRLQMSSGEQTGLYTLTFRKFADGWKIIHDHTS